MKLVIKCDASRSNLVQAKPISSDKTIILTDCKPIIDNICKYDDNRICSNTNINKRFFNLVENFNNLSIEWIPREKNIDADELVSVN